MQSCLTIYVTPYEEDFTCIGEKNRREALAECHELILLLRDIFGKEPKGAGLRTMILIAGSRAACHVVCWIDNEFQASIDYAHCCLILREE